MYTIVTGPNGTRFKKDARFVKKADIPADILIKLGVGMTDINEQAIEPQDYTCIFCGMPTKQFKLLNQQQVYICNDDYYVKTTGEIAKQLSLKET